MTETRPHTFSQAFETASEADWRAAVEKALKGRSPDTLDGKTADGLLRKALYRETDFPSATNPLGAPGAAPYKRGTRAGDGDLLAWDIRQIIAHPDPRIANRDALADLEGGVTSLELRIDPDGARGVLVRDVAGLDQLLAGIMTELAGIALAPVGDNSYGLDTAALLTAWSKARGQAEETQKFHFNVDPLGELARAGRLPQTLEAALGETVRFVMETGQYYETGTQLRADGRIVHEAGGTEAQELAFALAAGVEYVRALLKEECDLETASNAILFTLSAGADYTLDMAKLRAVRRLWARILDAFETGAAFPMTLQTISSRRMLTGRDPYVNLLRNTAAAFASGAGGADIVTIRPFTEVLGLPDGLARRLARNTQIIAQEESHLARVTDPVGGAWSVEALADGLAREAWGLFQKIEGAGGLGKALEADLLQSLIANARNDLRKAVARRKQAITGVSEFPLLEEQKPKIASADREALRRTAGSLDALEARDANWAGLLEAAKSGASLRPGAGDEAADTAEASPLWPMRLAEPFERLRDAADRLTHAGGARPKVFLATLGPLAKHSARAGFAANLFATGGIQAISADATFDEPHELGEAFAQSDCLLVCICGADDQYAEHAVATARYLREARSDARIYLAGKPGDQEADWRDAGVDEFIHMGVDVVACLELAHAELGLADLENDKKDTP